MKAKIKKKCVGENKIEKGWWYEGVDKKAHNWKKDMFSINGK